MDLNETDNQIKVPWFFKKGEVIDSVQVWKQVQMGPESSMRAHAHHLAKVDPRFNAMLKDLQLKSYSIEQPQMQKQAYTEFLHNNLALDTKKNQVDESAAAQALHQQNQSMNIKIKQSSN